MKNKTKQKPLFGNKVTPEQEVVPKKRGRPKKVVTAQSTKQKQENKTIIKQETPVRQYNKKWKPLGKTVEERPTPLKPSEIKFVLSDKTEQFMYVIIGMDGGWIVSDAYRLHRLREKAIKIFYRELDCSNFIECPSDFPDCEHCKKNKNS